MIKEIPQHQAHEISGGNAWQYLVRISGYLSFLDIAGDAPRPVAPATATVVSNVSAVNGPNGPIINQATATYIVP